MAAAPILVWFRSDFRLEDNPALLAASKMGAPVIPVFVWAPDEESPWAPGAASRWWLHGSLKSMESRLRQLGSRWVIRGGPTLEALMGVCRESGARAVFWNRRYEPAMVKRDAGIKASLRALGVGAESFSASLLHEPWTIQNRSGGPFQVFTPFWKACLSGSEPLEPECAPGFLSAPARWPYSETIEALELLPKVSWAGGLERVWSPGEAGAHARLQEFLGGADRHYDVERDRPDHEGTSRLSPHLHFGEIGPRQVWHAVRRAGESRGWSRDVWRGSRFVAELGWREFAYHLLYHFPKTPERPLRLPFERFPWRKDDVGVRLWQRGRTGVPLVDAGMRELWTTGWMHNRVRMVVGSYLVKNLLISWEEGARWFWDTLVDADLASNTLGWQWVGGCGADAAPYFRVFNPVSQGRKFDPDGDYVRRWVPELAGLSGRSIHAPWEAAGSELEAAGVRLGGNYPEPMVSLVASRIRALDAFGSMGQLRAGVRAGVL